MTRVFHAVTENNTALDGRRADRGYWRMRFCWECQQDKPVATGKIFGIKGASVVTSAGKLRFACAECIAARAARKAEALAQATT